MTDTLTIRRPDDWHVHLRDGDMLKAVAPYTARVFGRGLIMPNLAPPVTTRKAARAYRDRIVAATGDSGFTPLMSCYLTDDAKAGDIAEGFKDGTFAAVKLYPAGATTNSTDGVTDISNVTGVLERMQQIGMPLLVHGEVTNPAVDIFDREAAFIERVLDPLLGDFPGLKVVFEHVTTSEAVAYVRDKASQVGATITAHHLLINRSDIFRGGIRPHLYCLPVAKREKHRLALRQAATSGEACFFLGTDTAPHAVSAKEAACGCAGIFTAPTALELYATVFDEEGALDKLEAFASLNGAAFYGLEPNPGTVTLSRSNAMVPETVAVADGEGVSPFMAGESCGWTVASG